jgi:hypothetical protein
MPVTTTRRFIDVVPYEAATMAAENVRNNRPTSNTKAARDPRGSKMAVGEKRARGPSRIAACGRRRR